VPDFFAAMGLVVAHDPKTKGLEGMMRKKGCAAL
jgi:hypothetical protein